MHRHKHVSCSDNAWELYGLHVPVIFCMVCLPVACCLHDYSVNLYIYSAWNVQQVEIERWMLLCGCSHTLDKEHPQFTYGLPKEHLRTWTKEQRSRIAVFSSAKPPRIERDSGSPVGFFHVLTLQDPGDPCSTVGKPHFFLLLSCSKTSNYRPTFVCFVIVNNQDELPMINNIALTSTPMLPGWFCFHIQYNFLCL